MRLREDRHDATVVPAPEHPARRNALAITRSFLSQGLGDALEWERNVRSMLVRTPDHAAGKAAFHKQRPAQFGRRRPGGQGGRRGTAAADDSLLRRRARAPRST